MPSTDIKEIIARRTDLGTFIVHLTKDALGQNGVVTRTARDNLVSIIRGGVISACTPFGHGTNTHRNNPAFPKQKHLSVCFSETPLEYLYLLTEPIEGRRCCFEPYGIAVTKKIARKSGANPVLYADITCGHDWDIANAFNQIIRDALEATPLGQVSDHPVFKITPFVEQIGACDSCANPYRKEFWWEREWRKVGDYHLSKYIIICPESDRDFFRDLSCEVLGSTKPLAGLACLDPKWGIEQIIASFAGFHLNDITVF